MTAQILKYRLLKINRESTACRKKLNETLPGKLVGIIMMTGPLTEQEMKQWLLRIFSETETPVFKLCVEHAAYLGGLCKAKERRGTERGVSASSVRKGLYFRVVSNLW